MAGQRVSAAVVRVNSKKIAEAHSAELTVSNGREEILDIATAGAIQGFSEGLLQSKVTLTAIQPVAGMKSDLFAVVTDQTYVSVVYDLGGAAFQIDRMVSTEFTVTSETAKGMLEGRFSFVGGTPHRFR